MDNRLRRRLGGALAVLDKSKSLSYISVADLAGVTPTLIPHPTATQTQTRTRPPVTVTATLHRAQSQIQATARHALTKERAGDGRQLGGALAAEAIAGVGRLLRTMIVGGVEYDSRVQLTTRYTHSVRDNVPENRMFYKLKLFVTLMFDRSICRGSDYGSEAQQRQQVFTCR